MYLREFLFIETLTEGLRVGLHPVELAKRVLRYSYLYRFPYRSRIDLLAARLAWPEPDVIGCKLFFLRLVGLEISSPNADFRNRGFFSCAENRR